jgi:hypothetical protein
MGLSLSLAIQTYHDTSLRNPYSCNNAAEDFKSNPKIVFDEFLPQWNYTAKPKLQVI